MHMCRSFRIGGEPMEAASGLLGLPLLSIQQAFVRFDGVRLSPLRDTHMCPGGCLSRSNLVCTVWFACGM